MADLDVLRRRATVSENAVQVGSEIFVGTTKAHKQRSVPLPEFLLPYLARQCERRGRDDLLFPGDDGGHLDDRTPRAGGSIKAVAESGVPRVTPHDLRHTAASLAVSAGANVKAVQRMLGHFMPTGGLCRPGRDGLVDGVDGVGRHNSGLVIGVVPRLSG